MKFISTRSREHSVSFADALFQGLAPDGGLYAPQTMPDLTDFFLSLSADIDFNSLAARLTARLLSPEIDEKTAADIVNSAFNFQPQLRTVCPGMDVLELFHGPSCAFKDFGASFLASAMNHLLAGRHKKAVILTATSGDTGSAVAQAFYGKNNIDVIILYPSGRVSPLQEKQLTTLGGNITALEVSGTFDDCQRMVKAAFTDYELNFLPLSSANSINLGRLLPQSFYYIWAWNYKRQTSDDFAFVVPSGNFGNITAGLYAAAWGLPVKHYVAATNANKVIPEYLETGKYNPRKSVPTYSNAMDVGAPSNYERLDSLYNSNIDTFRHNVQAFWVNNSDTLKTIKSVYEQFHYFCCPHTAVGWKAAENYRLKHPEIPCIILSTAHPGKFEETVKEATGKKPPQPEALAALVNRKKVSVKIGSSDKDLKTWLLGRYKN